VAIHKKKFGRTSEKFIGIPGLQRPIGKSTRKRVMHTGAVARGPRRSRSRGNAEGQPATKKKHVQWQKIENRLSKFVGARRTHELRTLMHAKKGEKDRAWTRTGRGGGKRTKNRARLHQKIAG